MTVRAGEAGTTRACRGCLRRGWLLGRLAGHLEPVRSHIDSLLGLDDEDLIAAVGGRQREQLMREHAGFRSRGCRRRLNEAEVEAVCHCDDSYPGRLRDLATPPAVLFVAGPLHRFVAAVADDSVAIVGTRRPSAYGQQVAQMLGRELARAGLAVVSGMAFGIDSAAHTGTLDGGGIAIAVLPAGPDRPYPREKRRLYRRVIDSGSVISELPPGSPVRRWTFAARNRVIAGLAPLIVVVEAAEKSGALLTASVAAENGRRVGAVPGRVTAPQAAGPNQLLADGGLVIRHAQDVLDAVFGAGARAVPYDARAELPHHLRGLLAAIAAGAETHEAIADAGLKAEPGMAAVAELELLGYVRRGPGGSLEVVP